MCSAKCHPFGCVKFVNGQCPAQSENDPSDSNSDVSITTVKQVEPNLVMRGAADEWDSPKASDQIEEPLRLIDECASGDEEWFANGAEV